METRIIWTDITFPPITLHNISLLQSQISNALRKPKIPPSDQNKSISLIDLYSKRQSQG